MTIHRVGPESESSPHWEPLGKLLVTIDDLEQLIALLQRAEPPLSTPDVQIEFDGGHFTDAIDLIHLSDDEVRSLRIRTRNAEVVLEPTQAVAIGPEALAVGIYRNWARSRQTKQRPRHGGFWKTVLLATLAGILASVLVGGIVYIVIDQANSGDAGSAFLPGYGVGGLIGGLVMSITTWNRENYKPSYAIIKPMSLADYRRLVDSNRWPRWQTITAVASVAVAIVAIVVAVLTATFLGD